MDFFQASVEPPQVATKERQQPLSLLPHLLTQKPTTNDQQSAIAPVQQPLPPVQQQSGLSPEMLMVLEAQKAIALARQSQSYDPQAFLMMQSMQSKGNDRTALMAIGMVLGCFTLLGMTAVLANTLPNATTAAVLEQQSEAMREVARRPGTNICILAVRCPGTEEPPQIQQNENVQTVGDFQ